MNQTAAKRWFVPVERNSEVVVNKLFQSFRVGWNGSLLYLYLNGGFDHIIYNVAEAWTFGPVREWGSSVAVFDHILSKGEIADILENEISRFSSIDPPGQLVEKIIMAFGLEDAPDQVDKPVRGWKGLLLDMTSRFGNMQYEIGKDYSMGGIAVPCQRGYHFCHRICDVFNYYPASISRVVEVEASGRIVEKQDKMAATRIKILRDVPDEEVLEKLNACCLYDYAMFGQIMNTLKRRIEKRKKGNQVS